MRRIFFTFAILVFSILQGCSEFAELAIFNNSSEEIEICNLNFKDPRCQKIAPKAFSNVVLMGDKPASTWSLAITRHNKQEIYKFNLGQHYQLSSKIYCSGLIYKSCSVPVQYESSGILYWGGNTSALPAQTFPEQPLGFPISPAA